MALALTTDTSLITAISNDWSFDQLFERQIDGLATKKDVILGISTSGNSVNVLKGLEKAKTKGAYTIAFLGKEGGKIKNVVDLSIVVPSNNTARIQEVHITMGHIISKLVEDAFSQPKKIMFLDRDGTIIKDKGYMYKIEDLEFVEGSIEALKELQKHFDLVIVTNQSGIGRGYFSEEEFWNFHNYFLERLNKEGIKITETLMCPHKQEDNCECRKPKTGLIDDFIIERGFELDKENSFLIGDKTEDIKLAENLKINGVLVETGKKGEDNEYSVNPIKIAKNLLDATCFILKQNGN